MKRGREIYQWLAVAGLVFMLYKFVDKESLMSIVERGLPPREGGMLLGIVLGEKGGFSKEMMEYLKNSGLLHLMVVSGSNVMLLVGGLIETMASFVGRKKAVVAGMTVGFWYTVMVGWEMPVVRAMLMLAIFYWGQLIGRKYDVVRGLMLAVGLMILGEWSVIKSVSMWMSVAAFVGVVTAGRVKPWRIMPERLWETVWVSLWLTPILAIIFGKISLVSPLTNLAVMGMVEWITIVGVVGMMAGRLIPMAGQIILWLDYPLLGYLAQLAKMGGGKWAVMMVDFNWWMLVGWYLGLIYVLKKVIEKDKMVVAG